MSYFLHLGGTERWSQDAPHSLPVLIPQHEQTVRHGFGGKAKTLHKERQSGTCANICYHQNL